VAISTIVVDLDTMLTGTKGGGEPDDRGEYG
jgi:hypothetical protein